MADNTQSKRAPWWLEVLMLIGLIFLVSALVALAEEVIGLRKFRMK